MEPCSPVHCPHQPQRSFRRRSRLSRIRSKPPVFFVSTIRRKRGSSVPSLRLLSLGALVSALFSTLAVAQSPAPAVRLVNPIDESRLVTIGGTVHPLANAANDRGVAPDDMPLDRLQVVLKRSPEQETALRDLLTQMHTPGSPN